MPLLEREHILPSFGEYAKTAADGEGRLLLVSGEAGVGRSVLLERFQKDSADARWPVRVVIYAPSGHL
jgi:predicted ATP-dependent serine protease